MSRRMAMCLPKGSVSSFSFSLASARASLPAPWRRHICLNLSAATHLVQAIYFRLWFLLPTVVLCGLGELVGWSGRLWSSYNIQEGNAFLMQYVCRVTDGCVPDGFTGSRLLLLHLPREYIAAQDVHSAAYPFPDSLPPISLCSEGLS